jgi:hypothetical protein
LEVHFAAFESARPSIGQNSEHNSTELNEWLSRQLLLVKHNGMLLRLANALQQRRWHECIQCSEPLQPDGSAVAAARVAPYDRRLHISLRLGATAYCIVASREH